MSQENGNTILVMIVLFGLVFQSNLANATTYTVGGSKGWTFGVAGWENGKSFKTGDTLVFNYNRKFHNVVVVDKASYDSCMVPTNATTHTSGADQIVLVKGANYFICGFPGHCQIGLKIAPLAA